eukprot:CAMPEP_0198529180 /NCGR_PEP_ID=MMETSP1462-20131121/25597_1 /TAXON_ID=1333877 /ORGANISM="Brandtodinium nutriculum, Strain RCC3387" /LENGTH=201 /DNA_ID=CAMNT_0044259021 /DNA_START=52 /DNA_END=655 /DNA_ORIENTATION=-
MVANANAPKQWEATASRAAAAATAHAATDATAEDGEDAGDDEHDGQRFEGWYASDGAFHRTLGHPPPAFVIGELHEWVLQNIAAVRIPVAEVQVPIRVHTHHCAIAEAALIPDANLERLLERTTHRGVHLRHGGHGAPQRRAIGAVSRVGPVGKVQQQGAVDHECQDPRAHRGEVSAAVGPRGAAKGPQDMARDAAAGLSW